MNTGLVTFYHIHHYGAFLQAYATQHAVETFGGRCEILNYYVNQNNDLFRKPVSPGAAAADAHTALHYRALKDRYDRFEEFTRQHLHVTERHYETRDELYREPPEYDVYLSGSDQIWNPKIFPDGRFDPVYFSGFTQGRKIAYAPSFGIPRVPESMEQELRDYLSQFSHLSAREVQGREIIRRAGREARVVLDPTLLLRQEEWGQLAAAPKFRGGYILVYCISKPGALSHYIARLAEATGLPVVQLCGIRQKVHPKAHCVLDAGPAEFLGLFRGAAYVCTNSFHGTVFSVQFEKPFFTAVAPSEMAKPEVSRTYSLLGRLGLTDRIIGKGDTAELAAEVDWEGVRQRLEEKRRDSLEYLRCALENEPLPEETAETAAAAGPRLADRMDCTGCTACKSGCPKDAIAMKRDREGFAYPVVNPEACVGCGRCTAVCPALHPRKQQALPVVYAAWNRDETVRKDSTSGGVFSLLAEDTLESGGVVFGAAFDSNMHLRHTACFTKGELRHLRGAKYVQSDLGETYREVKKLLENRPVLFSGTPCQVDGLYRYLGCRPENLTTCDLVCHGVPSPGVWEDYAALLQAEQNRKLRSVRFRNKVSGWQNSHLTMTYDDGAVESAPLFSTEYGHAFGRALFLRPSCYRCAYTSVSRPGDFTLGDFWGLKPDELADQQKQGISMLMVNTPHGSHIFDRLPVSRVPYPMERAVAGNPRMVSPTAFCPDRAAFFAAYVLRPFEEVRKQYFRLRPLPVRAAAKALSPEMKAKIKKVLKK
ncbi:polysaccharide pyruvyl transferase family protein [Dysosmobacter sp.]|uniref:polysaccharide pyruvyl transferase family protein n=1 Tax=Dysosmobacter sp. TaxID=2591382 RepID=UPI002A8D811F|nr:polysaccharide pyruvyl transferase family protein [Dysosmobacter sp.]MDY3281682.1 polysaccharide pyruvyl transferase family protein [Dysosmobacter sp.]